MADTSNIAWTKSTFNPWIGCTRVSPGCDSCYAEALDRRHKWGGTTHWGPGQPRHRTSATYWHQPLVWDRVALKTEFAGRAGFWPVFCASLADVFDNAVPAEWRGDLWALIEKTPNLSWLLVTKRIGNVSSMVPATWMQAGFPARVRLLITVVNQGEADRDIPKLLALPCKNGVSYEPALSAIDWRAHFWDYGNAWRHRNGKLQIKLVRKARFPEWVIVGGESAQGSNQARPFNVNWARTTAAQCKAAGVACFVKQLGSHVLWDGCSNPGHHWPENTVKSDTGHGHWRVRLKHRAGAAPAEWPDDLRLREFPIESYAPPEKEDQHAFGRTDC